ncbi:MAG: HupE/UreJ family protein [Bacteroidota bacterium]
MFPVYFNLGLEHILDLNGYDHILFLVALCAIYTYREWRDVLVLVTAFTIGHSITLALSALNLVVFSSEVIEFLIPVTIFLTALRHIITPDQTSSRRSSYALALVFGWIHGLGFSNYFKALLGREESVVGPLFAFNIGVEAGQLVIVAVIMVLSSIVIDGLRFPRRDWSLVISGAAAGISLILAVEAKFW